MSSPEPDTTGTIDGAAPRDDVLVAGTPDVNAPGLPPGAHADPAPNRIYAKRPKKNGPIDDGTPPPNGNASKAEWADYATQHRGADRATADAMSRDELRQVYGGGPVASRVGQDSKGAEDEQSDGADS